MAYDSKRQGIDERERFALDIAEARTLEDLACLLRALRRRHARGTRDSELPYRELASRTGWSPTAIAEYFTARTLPPTDRFDALVRLLGATPAEQGALATARDRLAERRRAERTKPVSAPARSPETTPPGTAPGPPGTGPAGTTPAPPDTGSPPPDTGPTPAEIPRNPLPDHRAPPRQLPADVSGFAGRQRYLARLDALLASPAGTAPTAVVIAAVSGTAGVGKTALAVHWAHRVADRFPDGQLYVDLRGFDPTGQAMDPAEAVHRFLDALGMPAHLVPVDVEALAALYRSTLAGRRMLILLDNARDVAQVRPLLPGVPECLVLVTSRHQLTGLVATIGAHPVNLDRLPPGEARDLLNRRIGAHRVAAEPDAAEEIVVHCARLPLALVIVAARAATHPHRPLGSLAAQLRDSHERLDSLVADDDPYSDVRAVLSWSYRALPAPVAGMFRLLGWFPGPSMSAAAAAALADVPLGRANQMLDALATTHVLETDTRGRYYLHDLLRVYAAEQAHAEMGSDQCVAAAGRVLAWYLHCTIAAAQLMEPGVRQVAPGPAPDGSWQVPFAGHEQALDWCDAEQPGAVARAQLAVQTGHDELAWKQFVASGGFFLLRRSYVERIAHGAIALRAAGRTGDRHAEACVLNSLGLACAAVDRTRALDCYRRALYLRQEIGDLLGEAATLNNLGPLYWELHRYDEALDCLRGALTIADRTGNRHSQIVGLNNLGEAYLRLGRVDEALPCQQRALTLARTLNHAVSEGFALHNLGGVYRELGRYDEARQTFQEALAVRRRSGDRHGEATTLVEWGNLCLRAGQAPDAGRLWRRALAIYEDLGVPEATEIRRRLAGAVEPAPARVLS
jgi:tetratricopeptide (TPR) repeat protein